KALKLKNPALYAVAVFLPLVGLIVMIILIRDASRILRKNDIKVGVMGYKEKDLGGFTVADKV
ncbi:MAG: hypothetical protein KKH08_01385, partial [Candidatus Omnitrophica bacterium]|nr:hypothetical protein [Candidatus Omnitrophota bacterium]